MHEVDHILWEESNLQEGEQRFAGITGVTPVFGGKHPGRGSHNSLLALGGNKYLEIIAPDPEQAAAANLTAANFLTAANLNQEKLANFTPRLLTFAVRAYDLTHAQKLMKEAGLEASDLRDGSRQLPSGGMLKWQSMSAGGHEFGRLIPFFIQWGDTTHRIHQRHHPKGLSCSSSRSVILTAKDSGASTKPYRLMCPFSSLTTLNYAPSYQHPKAK
jgi:hypothetical protein